MKLNLLACSLIFYLVQEETDDAATDIGVTIIVQMRKAGTHAIKRSDCGKFLVHGLVHFQKNFKFRENDATESCVTMQHISSCYCKSNANIYSRVEVIC